MTVLNNIFGDGMFTLRVVMSNIKDWHFFIQR